MTNQDGNAIQVEIKKKQTEIDNLDKYINKKKEDLSKKSKEIDQKREQLKTLDESRKKQEAEINEDLIKLRDVLKTKEDELKAIQALSGAQKEKAGSLRKDIQSIQTQIVGLNAKKIDLEKKQAELSDSLEASINERDAIHKEKVKFENEKKAKEKEIKALKADGLSIAKWMEFIEKIYAELLHNQELFKKRAELNEKFKNVTCLMDMYNLFMGQSELAKYRDHSAEKIAKENESKRREVFENSFKNILAEPSLFCARDKSGNSVVELTGINVNFGDVMQRISMHVDAELKKTSVLYLREDFDAEKKSKGRFLAVSDEKLFFKDILKKNNNIPDELKILIDRFLKVFLLFF